jgi:hypothetical protein
MLPLSALPFHPAQIPFHDLDTPIGTGPGVWIAGAPSGGSAFTHLPSGATDIDLGGLAPAPYVLLASGRSATVMLSLPIAEALAGLTHAAERQADLRTSAWYSTGADDLDSFGVRVLRVEAEVQWEFDLLDGLGTVSVLAGPTEDASATFGAYGYSDDVEPLTASDLALDPASGRLALTIEGKARRTGPISASNAYRLAALARVGGMLPQLDGGGVCVGRYDSVTASHEPGGVRFVVNTSRQPYVARVRGPELAQLVADLTRRADGVFPLLSSLDVVGEILE